MPLIVTSLKSFSFEVVTQYTYVLIDGERLRNHAFTVWDLNVTLANSIGQILNLNYHMIVETCERFRHVNRFQSTFDFRTM